MKQRLHLIILLAAVTLSGMAQTIGEAFYVYRNDGQFNAFFRDEVISIEYSYEDAEGNTYDEIVTQIVNTADSVYKIPLAAIDSVGFVQPEVVLKIDVVDMDEGLRGYIVSATSSTIEIAASVPSELLPKKEDKVVFASMDDLFPTGFAGIVSDLSQNASGNYVLTLGNVSLEDVFDKYYCPFSALGKIENNASVRMSTRRAGDGVDHKFRVPPFKLQMNEWFNLEPDKELAFNFGTDVGISVTPSFRLMGFLILDKELGTSINATIIGDYNVKEWLKISGKGAFNKDLSVLHVEEPIAPFVSFFLDGGFFAKFEGSISADFSAHHDFRSVMNISYDSNSTFQKAPILKFSSLENKIDNSFITADVTTSIGTFTEVGLSFVNSSLDRISGRAEGGIVFNVHGNVYMSELQEAAKSTDFYQKLNSSDAPVSIYPNYNLSLGAKLFSYGISKDLLNIDCPPFFEGSHVPAFSNVSVEQGDGATIKVQANPSGFCIKPVKVGFILVDENNTIIETKWYDNEYYNDNSFNSYSLEFYNIELNKNYTIYPAVEVFGHSVRALPAAEAIVKINVVTGEATNVKTTTATVSGDIRDFEIGGYEHGICYGNSGSKQTWVYQPTDNANSHYSVMLRALEPATTYRYAAYIKIDNHYYYGDENEFHTEIPIEVTTGEATDITDTTANLIGSISCSNLNNSNGVVYFYYNTTGNPSASNGLAFNVGELIDFPDGTFSATLSDLAPNTTYYYVACVNIDGEITYGKSMQFKTNDKAKEPQSDEPTEGEAVDLGLSVKWRSCNLGGTKPEEIGGRYSWGGLQDIGTQEKYYQEDYYETIAKATGNNISGTQFDAARVNLGGNWRMPTKEEFQELIEKCELKETTYKEVHGILFIGPNGNSIFIPNTGYFSSGVLENSWLGYYWTSTIEPRINFGAVVNYVYGIEFRTDFTNHLVDYINLRDSRGIDSGFAYCIRPVW